MRIPLLLLILGLLLVAAPAAQAEHAGVFAAEPLDGPSAAIRGLGGVDLSRDGTGGLVYIKDEAGVPHVFLSRFRDGTFQPAERVDLGVETAATAATIAAGEGGRLALAFISGGRLFGSVIAAGAATPVPQPTLLHADPDPFRAVEHVAADLGTNGVAYLAFTAPGDGGTDVRAARLEDTSWTVASQPLDIDAARAAGAPGGRPDVAVAADGNAIVTWGEVAGGGQPRLFARRLTGTTLSVAPQEISVYELGGAVAGAADSADIDVEDDGSYAWVAFRQDVGGTSRVLARRLVGSLFEAPVEVDGGGPAVHPAIDVNGRGVGAAVFGLPAVNGTGGAVVDLDVFGPTTRLSALAGGAPPAPLVAMSERRNAVAIWRHEAGAGSSLVTRYKGDRTPWEGEVTVSRPDLGPVAARHVAVGTDSSGNMAIAFLQGDGADRRLVWASYDRRPGLPVLSNTTRWQNRARTLLKWRAGSERWGAQTYKVIVDGSEVGTAPETSFQLAEPLRDGVHRWQVVAVDRRGQEGRSRTRILRIDASAPTLRVSVKGARRRGSGLVVAARARERGRAGLRDVRIHFGDRTAPVLARRAVHRYRRPGRYVIRVAATDGARNVATVKRRVRIRK